MSQENLTETPHFLTEQQAQKRSRQFVEGTIDYKLQLLFNPGETFSGVVETEFNLSNVNSDLFIDFSGSNIDIIVINNKQIPKISDTYEDFIWNGLFLKIPVYFLNNGRNTLTILFKNEYANDGCGLHSFIDSDDKQYIYSQCEPFHCNKIFPCFDQPDLKATLQVTIIAPKIWVILSNELKSSEDDYSLEAYKRTNPLNGQFTDQLLGDIDSPEDFHFAVFQKTQLYPTYLFGFAAGPYKEIKCETTYNNISMSLFCRESLIEYLKDLSEFIFEVTKDSMKLYEEFFGYPYPFKKYDSVFCPEFNAGAMENTGMVTFNDEYVFREEQTASSYASLAVTITHELSHHWFGNLVTMKWWNDLWLNESFADFISHYVLSKMNIQSKPISDIWVEFHIGKSWGYRTDQQMTTHPIACVIENTDAGETIFDGISYSKGSAVLRQLMSLIGEQPFSDALKKYFKKFAFKNAVLNDLIEFFDQEFQLLNLGFSLEDWQKSWIQTAGLNECQPVFNPQATSDKAELRILQKPSLPQHPTLRRHKIQVAFFDADAKIHVEQILLNETAETVLVYDASKTPYQAVLLNYGDWGFIKVLLDDISIEFFKNNLHKINDVLTRTLIWRSFYDMVRDAKISSEEYIEFFMKAFSLEESDDIISSQIYYLTVAFAIFTPEKYKVILGTRIFDFLLKYLISQPEERKNRIIAVRDVLGDFVNTEKNIRKLLSWYKGEDLELKNIEMTASIQWKIVALAHKFKEISREEKVELYANQAKEDPSDTAQNYEHNCKALQVTPEERASLWEFYLSKENDLSIRNLEYSFSGFNSSLYPQELEPYFEKFFEVIRQVYNTKPKEFANTFFENLLPNIEDSEKLISSLEQLQNSLGEDQVFLLHNVKEAIDDTLRKQRACECFKSRTHII